MNKKLIRRALALAGAASLCLACAAPVFAADSHEPLEKIRLGLTNDPQYGTMTLTGPSVDESGAVRLNGSRKTSFTCETTFFVEDDDYTGGLYESPLEMRVGYQGNYTVCPYVLLAADDQSMTFGKLLPGTEIYSTAEFRNVRLSSDAELRRNDTEPFETPFPNLEGEIRWETQCTIKAVATFPMPELVQVDYGKDFTSREEFDAFDQAVRQTLDQPAAQLAQPQKVTFRAMREVGVENMSVFFHYDVEGQDTWRDVSYYMPPETVEWEDGTTNTIASQLPVSCLLNQRVMLRLTDWVAGSSSVSATRAVATTAGAAALGLGGGAAANALSTGLDSLPAPKRREDFEDPDVPDDTPDLPEEDTPSVSVSFYRPFDDLVNTKGAAVDIQLTVNGGEGLHWNYLPTAICPGGLKAVIPAVVGSSNTATLVLNLTGAAMKKPHIPVFITVVAWAAGADGRMLKATGTMELQLHRPGLEAERTADGGLKVTLYADGNLDGVAEKVVLKPEQYTCTEEADGTLAIEAKPPYKGSCRIAGSEQEG